MADSTNGGNRHMSSREAEEDRMRERKEGALKHYGVIRDGIKHENDLINQRISWMLTIEGFAVAGFFAMQAVMLREMPSLPIVFVIELGLIGVLFCVNRVVNETRIGIVAAEEHIASLVHWWRIETGLKHHTRGTRVKQLDGDSVDKNPDFKVWKERQLENELPFRRSTDILSRQRQRTSRSIKVCNDTTICESLVHGICPFLRSIHRGATFL